MPFLDCKKLYSQGTVIYEILIVMIFLFTPYRFNEVDNKNGHPKPMSTVKQLSVL